MIFEIDDHRFVAAASQFLDGPVAIETALYLHVEIAEDATHNTLQPFVGSGQQSF